MIQRTEHYRNNLVHYRDNLNFTYDKSLNVMGTCGYMGTVPLKAITRVALVDIKKQSHLCWDYMNCQPSLGNYRFCGPRYRNLNKRIFGIKSLEHDPLEVFQPTKIPKDGIQILKKGKF
jgi:hypothetical protein